ncbi:unnamed protein product [Ilex paraguariensis]|uniref:Uncharacterized protein n=1 Tax=Ilex paraguariensis TaxID=185542 RepID=A0ABC8TFD8_9AQUA
MGICTSSHIERGGGGMNWPSTAKVIQKDGRLQEFRQPIKAGHILFHNPNCFLCSLEIMYVSSRAPHVPDDEELQLGQIYFLMPTSKSHTPLSLQDLCTLAIKASTALGGSNMGSTTSKASPCTDMNGVQPLSGPQGYYRIPTDFEGIGMNSPVARGNRRIEFYD